MSIFFNRFLQLCEENDTSPNAVAKKLSISSGSVTAWKNETTPRISTVQKLADYFGISKAELLHEKEKNPPPEGDGLTQEFARIFDQLSPQAQNEIIAEMLKRKRQEP